MVEPAIDLAMLGHRIRHLRRVRGMTLSQLAATIGRPASQLSLLENGKREPRLSLLQALAGALDVGVPDLLEPQAPNRRAELELAVERAQLEPLYADLGLPYFKPGARVPNEVLEHVVALYQELRRRTVPQAATPEQARQGNAALRQRMQERENYFDDVEALASETLEAVGYRGGGALPQRVLLDIATHFGFTVEYVQDLPRSVRSVSDLRHARMFIPQRDALGSQDARTVVLQTLGHFALGHSDPSDFADFLRQRVEANYFAGAVLVPESVARPFLENAKADRELSVADLEDVFGVSYEMAAHRFTNLATRHLGIPVHFLRTDEGGTIFKAYENDGVVFPADSQGAIEGQRVCRNWGARAVFRSAEKFSIHYQYTETPVGSYFCVNHVEAGRDPNHAVTVGTREAEARWFRGRLTSRRTSSRCPDPGCCQRPPSALAARWDGHVWPSARAHSHVLAALPAGTFPGVDAADVYAFLERHPAAGGPG